jgi:UDP:flavonoid glycosyltransferase YjiC (YdhE family)
MWPEIGHLLPTLPLSTELAKRGHTICYVGTPDLEDVVRSRGMEFVPFLEELFPRGFNILENTSVVGFGVSDSVFKRMKTVRTRVRKLRDTLFGEASAALINRLAPDLLVIDTMWPSFAIWAHKLRVPSVFFSVILPHSKDGGIPPLTSGIMPNGGSRTGFKIATAWAAFTVKRSVERAGGAMIGLWFDPVREIRKLADRCGYPVDRIDFDTTFEPMPDLPQLVPCIADFDFARNDGQKIHYFGPSIERSPVKASSPLDKLLADSPLVYCSLGSQSHQVAHSTRFFKAVVRAFERKPGWQLVMQIGKHLSKDDLAPIPSNVLVVDWVQPGEILRHASVAIVHAGLGTVKDCLLAGVPMIAFPLTRDQPGNAARIVHHGLGLRGDVANVSEGSLLGLLNTIECDLGFRLRSCEMGKKLEDLENSTTGPDLIESILDGRKTA